MVNICKEHRKREYLLWHKFPAISKHQHWCKKQNTHQLIKKTKIKFRKKKIDAKWNRKLPWMINKITIMFIDPVLHLWPQKNANHGPLLIEKHIHFNWLISETEDCSFNQSRSPGFVYQTWKHQEPKIC